MCVKELVIMKSTVAKHHSCKHERHCGLISQVICYLVSFQVSLAGSSVLLKNLRGMTASSGGGNPDPNAREVCMCRDGTVFIAPLDSQCKVASICTWMKEMCRGGRPLKGNSSAKGALQQLMSMSFAPLQPLNTYYNKCPSGFRVTEHTSGAQETSSSSGLHTTRSPVLGVRCNVGQNLFLALW